MTTRTPEELTNQFLDQGESAAEWVERTVYIADGCVVINVNHNEYKIELERCNTLEKILAWCVHLCEKKWMTPTILRLFVYNAAHENGLTVPPV